MSADLLRVRGLAKRFGGLIATDNVDLDVRDGEIHALIGPNGAGKTTLISQLFGELRQDAGTIHLAGEPIGHLPVPQRVRRGLARTFQVTHLLPDYTALDNVHLALQAKRGHSFRFFNNAWRDEGLRAAAQAQLASAGLGLRAQVCVGELSHGEQKQLELVIALAGDPRLLLLDEPMAGLGHVEGLRMIEILRALRGPVAILLVEHDLEAVYALADRISVLVYGRIIATGTVAEIRDRADVREAYLGEGES
jgi:branched-chain amino acid transport system ATP-binding protein